MHLQGYGFVRADVDVCFATLALQRQCNEESALIEHWGARAAASLSRTLQELAALDHLGDMAALPHIRLTGDSSGLMVIGSSDGCEISLAANDEGTSRGSAFDEISEVVVVAVAMTGTHEVGRSRA